MASEIEPVAVFRSPLPEKFGLPRQAGLAPNLPGCIELIEPYNDPEALRGLDGFDYLWLIWGFSLNGSQSGSFKSTVRPPRLGGNERIGVFASRSPFRPNSLGLSSVRIKGIDAQHCRIEVLGADLADGTPIYDIKPYVEYADSHSGIRSGFVDSRRWEALQVIIPEDVATMLGSSTDALRDILSQDPRPQYQDDAARVYGLAYGKWNIRFKVDGHTLEVVSAEENR